MNAKLLSLPVLAITALAGALATPKSEDASPGDHWPARYEVRITNLTRGQIFSPAVVALHSARQAPLFTLGDAPSAELAMVAEDAMLAPMVSALQASRDVADVQVLDLNGGPIPPGQSASVVVRGIPGRFDRVSMVGMLVTTNDAFYGFSSHRAPRFGHDDFTGPAYDAGSEANTEMCAHIPGPPCGNAGVRVPNGAEGFVHVHAGIHGIGNLSAAEFDWRNDVVRVEIRRL